MRINWGIILLLFCLSHLSAQESEGIDPNYFDDQIFFSLTYNVLSNKPVPISQNALSGEISLGLIRDIPLNVERNVGFGVGLGYAYNTYSQNLKITRDNQITFFELAQDYNTNRVRMHSIELPIEFRWRTSTLEKYKFWRIYGGLKLSYLFLAKSKFTDEFGTISTRNIPEWNKFQYGFILTAGYSTWNIYAYYGLNSLLKDAELNGQKMDLNNFKIGLKFYML